MDEKIRQTLLENDKVEGDLDYPSTYSHEYSLALKEEAARLEGFIKGLLPEHEASEVSVEYFGAQYAQDASYAARSNILYRSQPPIPLIEVRFSKFDKMVSILVYEKYIERIEAAQLDFDVFELKDAIMSELEGRGFKHIPREALKESYTGRLDLPDGFTWWDRFFNEI